MRLFRVLVVATSFAALLAQPSAAQEGRPFHDAWFWGVRGGVLNYSSDADLIGPASEAYRRALLQAGLRVLGERKKIVEGQVSFVLATPDNFDRERLEQQFAVSVPEPMRGALDWDVS